MTATARRGLPIVVPMILALALVLAGCASDEPNGGASDSPTPAESSILIWADPASAEAIEGFAAAHQQSTGVEVLVQSMSLQDIQTNLPEQAPQGLGPDLLVGRSEWVGGFVRGNLLAPIDLAAQANSFRPISAQAFRFEGEGYGVPFATESLALLRNTKLAPEAPASIEAMASDGLRLKKDGSVTLPVAMAVGDFGDAYHWHPFYSASGGTIFGTNSDGEYLPEQLGVGEPGSIAAAQDIAELTDDGVLDPKVNLDDALDAFTSGHAAYFISGPWSIAPAQEAAIPVAVSAVPGFADNPTSSATALVSSTGLLQSAFAANPEGAQQFLTETAMSTGFMTALAAATDNLAPAWLEDYQAVAASDPIIKGFGDFADASVPYPNLPEFDDVMPVLSQAQLDVMDGDDPQKTMTQAGTDIEEAMAQR